MLSPVLNGYTRSDGSFAAVYDVTIAPAASHAATFTSDTLDMGSNATLRIYLDVTACTGTLDVTVQTSHDGANDWRTVGAAFTQATGVTTQRKTLGPCDRYVRASCVIGTGPAVFSLTGQAC